METKNKRLCGLDGMRGVSIVLVLMLHSIWFKHLHLPEPTAERLGNISEALETFGVPIFFVISGFLITFLLLREEEKGKISLKSFWLRRFLRIVPPVAFYVIFISAYSFYFDGSISGHDLSAVFFFYRDLVGGSQITAHFWSLSLEEQFYVFWPFVLFFAPRPWRLPIATILLLAGPFIRIVSVVSFSPPHHALVMSLVRFDFILMGCLLALIWQSVDYRAFSRTTGDRLFIAGISLVMVAWWLAFRSHLVPCFTNMTTLSRVLQQEAITLPLGIGVCLIMITLVTSSTIWGKAFDFPLIAGIGVISYSLYLWQQFFFFDPHLPHFMMYLPVRIACAFAVAACGYYFIERPMATFRKNFGNNSAESKRVQ